MIQISQVGELTDQDWKDITERLLNAETAQMAKAKLRYNEALRYHAFIKEILNNAEQQAAASNNDHDTKVLVDSRKAMRMATLNLEIAIHDLNGCATAVQLSEGFTDV